jgi:hypothetical protein
MFRHSQAAEMPTISPWPAVREHSHLTGFPWHLKLEQKRSGTDDWVDVPISPADGTTDRSNMDGTGYLKSSYSTSGYPTFRAGYIANQIMDAVRSSKTQPLTGFLGRDV